MKRPQTSALSSLIFTLTLSISCLSISTSCLGNIQSQAAFSKEALFLNAIKAGQLEEVKTLLSDGADASQPFSDGVSPLHIAVINNHPEIVEILLQAGASPNVPDITTGASPLHLAALYGRLDIATLLIKKGANINAVMKFDITPLLVAAQFRQAQIIELLLNNKANIEHADQEGFTALHFTAQNGDDISAKILIAHGANVNMPDKTRKATPLQIATENKQNHVMQLLKEHGATG